MVEKMRIRNVDLWVWHLLTPNPKGASLTRIALHNLRNFICCIVIYLWATDGPGKDGFKLLVGVMIIFPLLVSGIFTIFYGGFVVADYLMDMEERYHEKWDG